MALAVAARTHDLALVELVDALVEAIDINRVDAIDRVREALEPFGATRLLNDELRLNGISSSADPSGCDCEVWL